MLCRCRRCCWIAERTSPFGVNKSPIIHQTFGSSALLLPPLPPPPFLVFSFIPSDDSFFHFFRPLVYRLSLSNALLLLFSSGGGVYNTRTALTAFAAFPFAASSSSTRSAVAYTYSPDLKFPHFKRFESSHRRSPGETRANR